MHELSIVEALIGQVQEEVEKAGESGRITRLSLAIGRLSGVHSESIRFAFELLTPGTPLEAAELQIRQPGARCCCAACDAESPIDHFVAECPLCASDDVRIEGGQDLLLETIELEE
jgi:hydrogenase nickel incorporation protein HypA/HybF